jgi:hypothetical protein
MASVHRRVTSSGETRWDVRYRDPNRVDRSKSFRLKSEAARFAASVEADIDRGEWLDPTLGRESFGYWAEQWLVTTYGLKPKTQEGYRSLVNHHLLPRLANTPVARVDLAMVSSVLSEISRSGAGAGTVGNIRGVLNLVLEQARLSGAIRGNPVRDTKAPKKPHQEMVFLTPEEIIVVSEEITDPLGAASLRWEWAPELEAPLSHSIRRGRPDLGASPARDSWDRERAGNGRRLRQFRRCHGRRPQW